MPDPNIADEVVEEIRPHWRFLFGGTTYEWRGHVGGADGLLLRQHAGITPVQLYAGVLTGEPAAIIGLVFITKRQAGERVTWDELVAQFEDDDDLFGFPQRVSNVALEAPDPAARDTATPDPAGAAAGVDPPAPDTDQAPELIDPPIVDGADGRHQLVDEPLPERGPVTDFL